MATKKLSEITEGPRPSDEDLAAAKAADAIIRGYDPNRVGAFLEGRITLGELEGIGKEEQYGMAKVGYELLNEGKLDDAKKVFEGLSALDPFDAYFITCLGVIAQQQGDLELAEQRYSRALEINPYSPSALTGRGEVYLLMTRLPEAATDFAGAIENDPEGEDPASHRARALINNVKSLIERAQAGETSDGDEPQNAN